MRRRVPDKLRMAKVPPDAVPEPLREVIGKREVWLSYGAVSHAEARRRHHREMARLDALFDEARRWLMQRTDTTDLQPVARMPIPSEADVRAAVRRWFYDQERKRLVDAAEAADPEAVVDLLNTDEAHLADADGVELAARRLPAILEGLGFATPPKDVERFALSMMQRAMVEGVRRERDRMQGLIAERAHDIAFADITAAGPAPAAPQRAGITFGALCDRYVGAPERAGISPKTRIKYAGSARVLAEILGRDTQAATITREACRGAQAVIAAMPANAAQRYPKLPAQRVVEAAKRDGVPPMGPKTVWHHMALLSAIFRWGVREGLLPATMGNPAEGLGTFTGKSVTAGTGERRRPFTRAELKAIFSAPLYAGCQDDETGYAEPGPNRPRRGRFWVPLLGLYAGLRLNEACQLHTADIGEEDGVPIIQVRATAEGQRVKTRAAERRIPVHRELQSIGFLAHVARQREADEIRLFPDLPPGKLGNYSDPFSKWFARFLEKATVTSPGAVFHSFRHGFRDRMREAGIPREVADALGGWAATGQGAAYGAGFSARVLAEHLARISYPGLSLTHLHKSQPAASESA